MGQHFPGMGHQQPQQVILARRQLHILFAHRDQAAHQIDRQIAAAEDRLLAVRLQAVAQRGANAGRQFLHAERLGDIIIGAQIERRHLAGLVVAAGKNDDGHGRAAIAQGAHDRQPIHSRQPQIEHDQVHRIAFKEIQRRLAAIGLLDAIGLRRQGGAQETPDRRFVVHDQDAQRGHALESANGTVTVKTAPPSARLAAVTVPPIASMKPRAMERPRPVPASLRSAAATR